MSCFIWLLNTGLTVQPKLNLSNDKELVQSEPKSCTQNPNGKYLKLQVKFTIRMYSYTREQTAYSQKVANRLPQLKVFMEPMD